MKAGLGAAGFLVAATAVVRILSVTALVRPVVLGNCDSHRSVFAMRCMCLVLYVHRSYRINFKRERRRYRGANGTDGHGGCDYKGQNSAHMRHGQTSNPGAYNMPYLRVSSNNNAARRAYLANYPSIW